MSAVEKENESVTPPPNPNLARRLWVKLPGDVDSATAAALAARLGRGITATQPPLEVVRNPDGSCRGFGYLTVRLHALPSPASRDF